MARRKKGSRRRSKKKISIMTVGGLLAGFHYGYRGYKKGGFMEGVRWYIDAMTGFDIQEGRFSAASLMKGAVPLIGGVVGSKVMTKFGVNRSLNIPYVKL